MTTQQQKDFDAFFANTKAGDTVKVGNLTYTRGTGDKATVTGPSGQVQNFTSSTNPQTLARNSAAVQASYQQNYAAPAQNQMQTDFNAALQRIRAGEQIDANGFTYRLNQYGQPVAVAPSGRTTPLEGRTFENIAWNNPELAHAWNQTYGTNFDVRPIGPTYWGNYLPQMQIGGIAMQDRALNDPVRQRIEDVYRNQYGSSPMDPNPQPFDPNTVGSFAPVRNALGQQAGQATQQFQGPFTSGPVRSQGLLGGYPGAAPNGAAPGGQGFMPGFQAMPNMGGGFQAQNMGMPFMTTPLYGGFQPQFFNTAGVQAQQGQAYDPFTNPFGATNLLQNSWTRGA